MTRAQVIPLLAILLAACGGGERATPPREAGAIQPTRVVATPVAIDAAPSAPLDAPVDAAPEVATPAAPEPGYDFIAEVNVLFRAVACNDATSPLPEALTHGDAARAAKLQKVIDHHCAAMKPLQDQYRDEYFDKARAWFVAHEPADLPTTVVYGFGGGDLISMLVAFPKATEITTVSLELAGDPRSITNESPEKLERDLAAFRHDLGTLIGNGSNLSVNLSDAQRNAVAAQLSSHLIGLSTGGYELVSARFFTLDAAGAIHYLEKDEIDADHRPGHAISGAWKAPTFAQSFGNVELRYRVPGERALRVHRHIAWNLADGYLHDHPALLAHLGAKGKVALCVKGASYLLWTDGFSTFRKYLVDHLAWMVSDSTGLAPMFVPPTLEQEGYGTYAGPYLPQDVGMRGDLSVHKLFAKPKDALPFRYGYLDRHGHNHLIITHPK